MQEVQHRVSGLQLTEQPDQKQLLINAGVSAAFADSLVTIGQTLQTLPQFSAMPILDDNSGSTRAYRAQLITLVRDAVIEEGVHNIWQSIQNEGREYDKPGAVELLTARISSYKAKQLSECDVGTDRVYKNLSMAMFNKEYSQIIKQVMDYFINVTNHINSYTCHNQFVAHYLQSFAFAEAENSSRKIDLIAQTLQIQRDELMP